MRRALILVHRYLGIGLSLLFFVWFLSGIAMIYARGMPAFSSAARDAALRPIDFTRVRYTPARAVVEARLPRAGGRLTLLTVLGRPAYRFGETIVFADTARAMETLDAAHAVDVARTVVSDPAVHLEYAGLLEDADQWTVEVRRQLPLHKIVADDDARTELYVSPRLGEVVVLTTRASRALAWVAAIPHWLYFTSLRVHADLWRQVIIWTSGLGTIGALIGLVLIATQYRVRYRGLMRWHYVTGVIFGVFTMTWVFSGLLSVEPFRWAQGGATAAGVARALTGGPMNVTAFPAIVPGVLEAALPGAQIKEVEFRQVQGEPYFVLRPGSGPGQMWMSARSMELRREAWSDESILKRIAAGASGARIVETTKLADYDAYYRDREGVAPLPVLRVKLGDPESTWVYVDGHSQLVGRYTRRQRIERWIYHGFHSLDFPIWYRHQRLWEISEIALSLGGALLSAIGVVIGIKRVRTSLG